MTVRANLKYFFVFIGLFFLDQITKHLAYTSGFGDFLNSLHPVLGKELFPNYNFAFSLKVPEILMYVIYIALLGILAEIYHRAGTKDFRLKLALLLIFCGALSNILDRLMLGYVRDFIYIFWGNIFNIADLYILSGLILLLIRES